VLVGVIALSPFTLITNYVCHLLGGVGHSKDLHLRFLKEAPYMKKAMFLDMSYSIGWIHFIYFRDIVETYKFLVSEYGQY